MAISSSSTFSVRRVSSAGQQPGNCSHSPAATMRGPGKAPAAVAFATSMLMAKRAPTSRAEVTPDSSARRQLAIALMVKRSGESLKRWVHVLRPAVGDEVLVAVNHAGDEREAPPIDVFLVDVAARPRGLLADPGDGAVLHHHAGGGNRGSSDTVNNANVANDQVHASSFWGRLGYGDGLTIRGVSHPCQAGLHVPRLSWRRGSREAAGEGSP